MVCHTTQLISHENLCVQTTEHISKSKMNVTNGKKLTSPDIFSLYVFLQSSGNSDNL